MVQIQLSQTDLEILELLKEEEAASAVVVTIHQETVGKYQHHKSQYD